MEPVIDSWRDVAPGWLARGVESEVRRTTGPLAIACHRRRRGSHRIILLRSTVRALYGTRDSHDAATGSNLAV
ncbi:hypothetical protein C41B8_11478 [Salinisphaera hydrothermalis C41B8]|uniref:Uncharacterized protein n=1 Tax=Salinisphaera hydrothermalis (strain C41B8) TaxID=1304275 RepID=A0A084IK34_SALHC|nr:hypothetical protein C41B8_11478 [Salinisphaera hydrothermalis C41B8]